MSSRTLVALALVGVALARPQHAYNPRQGANGSLPPLVVHNSITQVLKSNLTLDSIAYDHPHLRHFSIGLGLFGDDINDLGELVVASDLASVLPAPTPGVPLFSNSKPVGLGFAALMVGLDGCQMGWRPYGNQLFSSGEVWRAGISSMRERGFTKAPVFAGAFIVRWEELRASYVKLAPTPANRPRDGRLINQPPHSDRFFGLNVTRHAYGLAVGLALDHRVDIGGLEGRESWVFYSNPLDPPPTNVEYHHHAFVFEKLPFTNEASLKKWISGEQTRKVTRTWFEHGLPNNAQHVLEDSKIEVLGSCLVPYDRIVPY